MSHVFGQHAFGMPVFDNPTIPPQHAGAPYGPSFDVRPTPPDFPGASAAGFGNTAIPMQAKLPVGLVHAGDMGPHFDIRPTPPNFPGASVMGLGGSGSLRLLDKAGSLLDEHITGPARAEIRKEAAAGAEAAVEPMIKKAILVSGVAIVISLIALVRK
jgi:hypothetical protein